MGYAIVTYLSWRDLRLSSERQLRAYLGLNGVELICPDCTPNVALPGNSSDLLKIHIKDFGQTPAYGIAYTVNLQMEQPHHKLPDDFTYPDNSVVLPPNIIWDRSHILIGGGQESILNRPVTEELREDILKSRYYGYSLCIYGHIDYETIFQKKCSVTYVIFYDHTSQPESFVHVGEHNGIDTCE